MSTKRQGVSCYDKAGEDEPLFVLRAQDALAGAIVRLWAEMAALGGTKSEIVAEAMECAEQMDSWHFHKWPGTSQIRHEADKP